MSYSKLYKNMIIFFCRKYLPGYLTTFSTKFVIKKKKNIGSIFLGLMGRLKGTRSFFYRTTYFLSEKLYHLSHAKKN